MSRDLRSHIVIAAMDSAYGDGARSAVYETEGEQTNQTWLHANYCMVGTRKW